MDHRSCTHSRCNKWNSAEGGKGDSIARVYYKFSWWGIPEFYLSNITTSPLVLEVTIMKLMGSVCKWQKQNYTYRVAREGPGS